MTDISYIDELIKWTEKCNAMMYESAKDTFGMQPIKLIILFEMMKIWHEEFLKTNKHIEDVMEIANMFLTKYVNIRKVDGEEMEKMTR